MFIDIKTPYFIIMVSINKHQQITDVECYYIKNEIVSQYKSGIFFLHMTLKLNEYI